MRITGQHAQQLLNRVFNAPEVLSNCAPGIEAIDLSGFAEVPGNVVFGDKFGIVIFKYVGDGQYEMHYGLTKRLAGSDRMKRIRAAINDLFTENGASAIVGSTPRINLLARTVNRALGGRPYGVSVDSQGRDCIDYVLERATWVTSSEALLAG
jgi:hypothetical protein